MNLSDIEKIERDFLTPAQIAPVIGADPNWIRWQAHEEPASLGFPVIVMRSRVKIPKEAFIKFMRGYRMVSESQLEREVAAKRSAL